MITAVGREEPRPYFGTKADAVRFMTREDAEKGAAALWNGYHIAADVCECE